MTSTVPAVLMPTALWRRTRETTSSVLEGIEGLAEREDVAAHPVAVRALRTVGGLRHRPAHEIALGVVVLGIMIATDSIVVDLAANVVAVLFVNHPHEPAADPAAATMAG